MQIHTLKLILIFLNPKWWAAWKADAHPPTGNHHFLLYSGSTDLMKKTYTGLWLLLLRFKIKIYEQVTVESRCGQLEQTTNMWEQMYMTAEREMYLARLQQWMWQRSQYSVAHFSEALSKNVIWTHYGLKMTISVFIKLKSSNISLISFTDYNSYKSKTKQNLCIDATTMQNKLRIGLG